MSSEQVGTQAAPSTSSGHQTATHSKGPSQMSLPLGHPPRALHRVTPWPRCQVPVYVTLLVGGQMSEASDLVAVLALA